MNLGSLLRETGREVYAEAALLRAVELRPDLVAGWINLAVLERQRGRLAEAQAHLRKALVLNPDQVETHIAWCQFCAAKKDQAGAWDWLRRALEQYPDQPEAANMQGILLHAEGRFAEAVTAFHRAEALGHRAAPSNRGNALLDMGLMDAALRDHRRAVDLDPNHPGALYNLALTQLRMGDWARGWPMYEARWRFREVHRGPRVFRQPRWQGESLDGRRILLYAEQGLGDTIQFCRYATLVAARGGFPILEVQAPLERLMRSLPVVRGAAAQVLLPAQKLPDFDLECPLMSLPAVFKTTLDTVPWPGAYLAAEPELAFGRRKRTPSVRPDLDALHRPLRVGLAWAGNPRYKADRQRSMDLEMFLPLLRTGGINWISLQKGPAAEQIAALPDDARVCDGSSSDRDLADTAALMATLDLVITTDTCIAHLAGAMAKPVWILLPHLGDWRWMQELETTPWYPTARLFRQGIPGDWPGVVNRLIGDLAIFSGVSRSPLSRIAAPDSQPAAAFPA
jgi:Tfp pilus assembly protein PilF